jgi:hypothetical protein
MRWFFLPLLLGVVAAAVARADDLTALQETVASSAQHADDMAAAHAAAVGETLRTLKALSLAPASDKARIALDEATAREQAATIGDLQAAAAARNARQRLTEAVTGVFEQGEAIERAAARAVRGEVTPSVADALACDGPDCARISPREHAALILMGAVGPSFDPAKWPPADEASPITVLAYMPAALPLATLRRAAEEAAERTREIQAHAALLRGGLSAQSSAADIDAYAKADAAARSARRAQNDADDALWARLRYYGDLGRAVKRAALLAGDGYSLKTGGKRACTGKTCIPAQGIEAAAFAVIGAAENQQDAARALKDFIVHADTGGVIFR